MKELSNYLPPVISEYAEVQKIHEAEAPEFELYNAGIDAANDDLIIETASEARLYDLEKMLDCVPIEILTLEQRKRRLQEYLKNLPSYALQKLLDDIRHNCISGYFSYSIWYYNYQFSIDRCDVPTWMWEQYYKKLLEIIPCNMLFTANNILSREINGTAVCGGAISKQGERRIGF